MTNCTPETVLFPVCRKLRIEAAFDGGDVTSNGGVLLLRQADRRLGLTVAVARRLGDSAARSGIASSTCCASGCSRSRWAMRI